MLRSRLRLTVATLAAVLLALTGTRAPARADGAASTRNIILGAAAVTLLIVSENSRTRHEREAEAARTQAIAEPAPVAPPPESVRPPARPLAHATTVSHATARTPRIAHRAHHARPHSAPRVAHHVTRRPPEHRSHAHVAARPHVTPHRVEARKRGEPATPRRAHTTAAPPAPRPQAKPTPFPGYGWGMP